MGINIPIHLQHVVIQYQPMFKAVPTIFIITRELNHQIIVLSCINNTSTCQLFLMINSTVHKP